MPSHSAWNNVNDRKLQHRRSWPKTLQNPVAMFQRSSAGHAENCQRKLKRMRARRCQSDLQQGSCAVFDKINFSVRFRMEIPSGWLKNEWELRI